MSRFCFNPQLIVAKGGKMNQFENVLPLLLMLPKFPDVLILTVYLQRFCCCFQHSSINWQDKQTVNNLNTDSLWLTDSLMSDSWTVRKLTRFGFLKESFVLSVDFELSTRIEADWHVKTWDTEEEKSNKKNE